MFELVYCSMASPGLSKEDVSEILETSISNNAKNNITGCLLLFNNEFAQILEGEESVVKALFNTIKKDQRHNHFLLLGSGSKDKRLFPSWSMAYQNLNESVDAYSSSEFVKNFLAFSELTDKPTLVSEIFFQVSEHILSEKSPK